MPRIYGLDNTVSIVVPTGSSLTTILDDLYIGDLVELHFEQTGFNVNNLPTWKVTRTDWENGGATT